MFIKIASKLLESIFLCLSSIIRFKKLALNLCDYVNRKYNAEINSVSLKILRPSISGGGAGIWGQVVVILIQHLLRQLLIFVSPPPQFFC